MTERSEPVPSDWQYHHAQGFPKNQLLIFPERCGLGLLIDYRKGTSTDKALGIRKTHFVFSGFRYGNVRGKIAFNVRIHILRAKYHLVVSGRLLRSELLNLYRR